MDKKTIVGLFSDRSDAESAVIALEKAGFTHEHIGFAGHGDATSAETTDHAGGALKGAARGSLSGGAVGGLLGALAAVLIPGIGPVIAGGLLAGIVAGAVAGGAVGGIGGALTGMGVSKQDADYYDKEFRGGRTLVTVEPGDRRDEAEEIMRAHGAHDAANRPAATGTPHKQ
jgi:hypothetical protein